MASYESVLNGWTIEASPHLKARIAGLLYLIVIVGGIFAEVIVRGKLVVHGDPASPVNLMEEPVHHNKQNEDGQQAGGCLDIERIDALCQVIHDTHGNKPGQECCEEGDASTGCDRAPVGFLRFHHAGSDCRKHQNALQSLSEYQDTDVQNLRKGAGPLCQRIGTPCRSKALPNQNPNDQ